MMEHVADDGVNALMEFHLPLVADLESLDSNGMEKVDEGLD